VVNGHKQHPFYPIVWTTQSLMVVYFSYKGFKVEKGEVYAEQ